MDFLPGWLAFILYAGGFGAFLVATVALVRRSERRLGGRPNRSTPSAPGGGGEDRVAAYLDQMAPELKLPAADVAEVMAELTDHLADSIADLEAEGFIYADAVREALGRLGPPRELGRQLSVAHQSTRRLFAGVGGGIFAAGGGFVLGYFGGTAVALVLMISTFAAAAALSRVAGLQLPNIFSVDGGSTANSVLLGIGMAVAAVTATRYAVRTSAGLSRRSPRSIAAFWAVAAGMSFGWWSLLGYHGPQSWPSIAIGLCIPFIAVAAAIFGVERPMPHVGRWAIVVVAVTVVTMTLLLAAGSGAVTTTVTSQTTSQPDVHLSTVAPQAPTAWLPERALSGGGWTSNGDGIQLDTDVSTDPSGRTMDSLLATWHDIRFEAWRALDESNPESTGIDPHYTTPLTMQSAMVVGDSFRAVLHPERLRYAGMWWAVLTGVGPDGHRYVLQMGGGGQTSFKGSVWEWLTAPQ
jgi:hypothetical protein